MALAIEGIKERKENFVGWKGERGLYKRRGTWDPKGIYFFVRNEFYLTLIGGEYKFSMFMIGWDIVYVLNVVEKINTWHTHSS